MTALGSVEMDGCHGGKGLQQQHQDQQIQDQPGQVQAEDLSGTSVSGRVTVTAIAPPLSATAAAENILCPHCLRTASNGIKCKGICVADSDY